VVYAIWDTASANIVDSYPTEDEALADVRDAVKRFGRDYALSWALARHDDGDQIEAIAEGSELIDRAMTVRPSKPLHKQTKA
jgi:hypothetical protein